MQDPFFLSKIEGEINGIKDDLHLKADADDLRRVEYRVEGLERDLGWARDDLSRLEARINDLERNASPY